ncbi:MAG: flagellar assembly protein FliH [Rhodobacteraceae bacterium HLUCCA08]|nr:MAG: flagellar assembly protein FliH [Rhodobacteraceae bacterium HLUCCA08]
MSVLSSLLESFDAADAVHLTEPSVSQDFLDGFAAGQEAALSDLAAQDHMVREGLQQALSDLAFGYLEAREHILSTLSPVLAAIVDKALPDLARDGMAARVVAYLEDVVVDAAGQPVTLHVAPGHGAILHEALGPEPPFPVEITEDATLVPGQALIRTGVTEALIDIDAITATIRETIGAITLQQRTSGNG